MNQSQLPVEIHISAATARQKVNGFLAGYEFPCIIGGLMIAPPAVMMVIGGMAGVMWLVDTMMLKDGNE